MISQVSAAIGLSYRFARSIKRMIANAAPWSFALKQAYLADFPADSLFEVYGSTELGVDTILLPADQLRKPGSCGQPAPMVEIKLFDEFGREVTGTGPDNPGELFVRSASAFSDYYKQHDKYLEDSREGFQTVGDVAYRDDDDGSVLGHGVPQVRRFEPPRSAPATYEAGARGVNAPLT